MDSSCFWKKFYFEFNLFLCVEVFNIYFDSKTGAYL